MSTFNSNLKEWNGPSTKPIFNPHSSVGNIIFYSLSLHKSRIAEIYADTDIPHLTYDKLKLQSVRVALNLQKMKIKPGDVVSLITFNNKNLSSIVFGCTFFGAPFNCVDAGYEKTDFCTRFKLIKPKLVICDDDKKETVKEVITQLEFSINLLTFEEAEETLFTSVEGEEDYTPTVRIDNAETTPVLICNTSGTTGEPKVSLTSHAYLISQSISASPKSLVDEILLYYGPIHWTSILRTFISHAVSGGTRILFMNPASSESLVKAAVKYEATILFAVPIHTTGIVNYLKAHQIKLNSIKLFLTGGYRIFDETKNDLKNHIPKGKILNFYGSTEAFRISVNDVQRPGSVGKLCDRLSAKIVNETNERMGPNEPGEICLKAQVPMLGYSSAAATKEAFDSEGFFHTGDIGHFDSDGFLYIEGRIKDLIKVKGVSFSAASVELFIAEKTGLDSCVIGLDSIDGTELPAVAIVENKSCNVREKDILKLVADNLPVRKHLLGGVYFMQDLPYSSTGKVRRNEVKKMLEKLYESKEKM